MSLNFPLDPDAVAVANAVILPKNGGKPLTMDSKDRALRKEWLKLYKKALEKKRSGEKQKKEGSLKFPLDPDAVAVADAVILPKNGDKPLTMDSKDRALRKEWLKLYKEALEKKRSGKKQKKEGSGSDPAEAKKECPIPIKRKNIIFIGSEMWYDSFWLKMMFIAPGFTTGEGKGPIRPADRTTVAYVDEGYTYFEKRPFDTLRSKHGHKILKLGSSSDIIAAMNDTPVVQEGGVTAQVKLQDVIFFSHGLPNEIALNYDGSIEVTLKKSNLTGIRSDVFVEDGTIWSYACRTGASIARESFSNDAEAKPEDSLAQKMADRFKVTVHAFIPRTFYGSVLRDPAHSEKIAKELKSNRKGREHEVINLSNEHEALPHPGLAEKGSTFWGTGPKGEGTNGFALWRKKGARAMPVAAETPKGLTKSIRVFKP